MIKEGIILINKPRGISSFDVIEIIRKITNIKKVGHAGTLDPEAEGLLIVCIGRNATKYASLFMKQSKKYLVEVIFGIKTSSADRDGIIQDVKEVKIDEESLLRALDKLKGHMLQSPPVFSAIHHKGKRLYELAGSGEEIEIKPRNVFIDYIKLREFSNSKYPHAIIDVACSSGTYIRSLVEDIGKELDSYAFVSTLTRLASGEFDLKRSYNLEDLKENNIRDRIIDIKEAVSEIKDT